MAELSMRMRAGTAVAAVAIAVAAIAAETPGRPAAELSARLEEYGARLGAVGFSGALLVARGDQVLLARGYGFADRARGVRNTADTVFPVGSITKQFTAAAILHLEERGKLHTDDPITRYFQGVPPDKAAITLHHLLTHSSGLVGGLGSDEEPIGREEYVKLALGSKLFAPPGTAYEYSNTGYSLLAAIVEQVSGQSWERYLRESLFLPAGMTQTGCVLPGFDRAALPHGYDGREDVQVFVDEFGPEGPYWHLRGNGGINSTIGDMHRWHQALLGDRVLSAASRKKAFTPYVREGEDADSFYGYGWALFKTPRGTSLVTHNGGNGIYTAEMLRFVDEGVLVYGAANDARFAAWEQTPRLAGIVFGEAVETPPPVATMPLGGLQELAGRYTLPSGAGFELQREGDALLAIPDGQEAVNALAAVRPQATSRYAAMTANTQALLDRIAAGTGSGSGEAEWGIGEAFHPRERGRRERLEKELGPLKAARALGALTRPEGRGAVLAGLDFARGTRYLQFLWGPRVRLWNVRELRGPDGVELFPESASALFSYTPSTGGVRRVEVTRGAAGMEALVLHAPSGPVRAVRGDPAPRTSAGQPR